MIGPTEATSGDRGRSSRRRFLALSSALVAGIAGCSGDDGQPDPNTTGTGDPGTDTADGTVATADGTPARTATPDERWGGTPVGSIDRTLPSPDAELAPDDGFVDVPDPLVADDVTVERVTTLDAEGDGSLRAALTGDHGPKLVVFEVGGVIDLDGEDVGITASNVYVAGQTAPSPGITVVRGGLFAHTGNIVVQHIRLRQGDQLAGGGERGGRARDGMSVTRRGENVVFDHCSVTWATDENMSTAGGYPVTFSNNLIGEGLNDSIHSSGEHSYGTLVMDGSQDVAVFGNVWAHNKGRHPRLKGSTSSVVVNNVAFNFDYAVYVGDEGHPRTATSVVGNHYYAGSFERDAPPVAIWVKDAFDPPAIHIEDNVVGDSLDLRSENVDVWEEPPLWPAGLEAIPADEVLEHNLANAGARPADRTPHDERFVENVRERSGEVIDSQDEVGGYPELEPAERELDVPDEGVREWLVRHTRAVELADAQPP